ncbi:hypothetical protein ACS6LB_04090 [Enterobacter cloacae]|uniref:hypothetical protein n=1 Tax=Enterobacter cloacae TaxID=550 RepID=UPI003F435BB7
MDCKKTNIALITIVSTLLIITCLVLVKYLLSDSKGFAWGSVSDWFTAICSLLSAVGTLGTLYVAFKALKKVPEWMAQKHYDIAYGHIEKSVYNDLRELRPMIFSIQGSINNILNIFNKIVISGIKNSDFSIKEIVKIDKAAASFQQKSDAIIEQLYAVRRTNYELTDDAKEIISLLTQTGLTHFNICDSLYELYDKLSFSYTGDDEQKNEFCNKITDLQNKSKNNSTSIIKLIYETNNGDKSISDFITPKKQKHP